MEKLPTVLSALAILAAAAQAFYTWDQVQAAKEQLRQSDAQLQQSREQVKQAELQIRLSVRPLIVFDTEDDPDDFPFGLSIENRGAGPAIIKSIRYYVNRVSFTDIDSAVAAAHLNSDQTEYKTFDADDPLGAGEVEWLVYRLKRYSKDHAEANRFADFLDYRLGVEVEYCSLLAECWKKCSTPGRCS